MNDIDITLADRRKPWDVASWSAGQRRTSETFATADEMLAAAGLANLNVQKRKEFTTDHDNHSLPTGKYSTVDSKGRVLGTGLSDRYQVIQMEQAFGFGDAIVDDGQAKWERAGTVRGGETAFGCMELSHLEVTVPGDDGGALQPYLLIVNSFGGWTPYMGVIAFIRPVCINTFEAAKGTKTKHRFQVRHTGTLDGKLQMAREALGIAFKHTEDVKELTTKLATTKLTERQVRAIIDQTWPKESKVAEDPRSPTAVKVWDHYQASSTLEGIRGTGWGVFNAVTEYIDHIAYQSDKPMTEKQLQQRGLNLILETGEARKERALSLLLAR